MEITYFKYVGYLGIKTLIPACKYHRNRVMPQEGKKGAAVRGRGRGGGGTLVLNRYSLLNSRVEW